jgi:hypothetical protein
MLQSKKNLILDTNAVIHFVAVLDIEKFNAVAHILTTKKQLEHKFYHG